jgi:histidyl-tRNA synthetase
VGDVARQALLLGEILRIHCPTLRLQTNCGGGSFKSQMKKADKSGASIALILGEDEAANNTVGIKFLRQDRPQETVEQNQLANLLITLMTD